MKRRIRNSETEVQEARQELEQIREQQRSTEHKRAQLQEKILQMQQEQELAREQRESLLLKLQQQEQESARMHAQQQPKLDPAKLSRVQDNLRGLSGPLKSLKNEVRADVLI